MPGARHPSSDGDIRLLNDLKTAVACGNVNLVQELLQQVPDIQATLSADIGNGRTLLHEAAECCSPQIVQLLIDHGAAVNALDSREQSPLTAALWGCLPLGEIRTISAVCPWLLEGMLQRC